MDTGNFKWSSLRVTDENVLWPDLRLTVDVPEDFEMVAKIFDKLYDGTNVFPLSEIVKLCRTNPEIPEINKFIMQKIGLPIKLKKL